MRRPVSIRLVPSLAAVKKDMSWTPITTTARVRYCGLHNDDAIAENNEREQKKWSSSRFVLLSLGFFNEKFSSTYSSKEEPQT